MRQSSARTDQHEPSRRTLKAGIGIGAVAVTAIALAQAASAGAPAGTSAASAASAAPATSAPPAAPAAPAASATRAAPAGASSRLRDAVPTYSPRKIEQGGRVPAPLTGSGRQGRPGPTPDVGDLARGSFRQIRLPVRADSVQATAINNAGVVAGNFTQGRITRGFVLDRGRFTSISLGNGTSTRVTGIGRSGTVVGSFVDSKGRRHGFVRSNGRTRAVDVPGARSTVVTGLNDRGQLVGNFTTANGRTVGFITTAAT